MASFAASLSAPRAVLSSKQQICTTSGRLSMKSGLLTRSQRRMAVSVQAHKVTVLDGKDTHVLDVPDGETILNACIDAGINVPYDCGLGTCCRCSAKLISGEMDLNAGMIDPDTLEQKGYVLLCTSLPRGDVIVQTIEEEELLREILDA